MELDHRQVLRIMYGVMAGMFLAALDGTIVATALPTLAERLGGLDKVTWVVTGYMLSTTVSAALWGKISDLCGRRSGYLAALGLFLAGSLCCSFAQNMLQLIAFRVLQGLGGGGLQSLSFVIMGDILPPRRRGRYIGLMSGTFASASVLGPLLGGFIVDHFSWRWIFLINLPLGLIASFVVSRSLRGVGTRHASRLDVGGALALSATVLSVLLAAVWGGKDYAWGSPIIVGLLLGALVLGFVFVWIERRVAEPILPMRLFTNRTLMVAVGLAATTTVLFQSASIYLPLFLQTVRHSSASQSGLLIAPVMIGMAFASVFVGRRVSVTGRYRTPLIVGLIGMCAVGIGLATLSSQSSFLTVTALMVVLGVSFGSCSPVINLAAQNAMPLEDLGVGTSALLTLRTLGGTMGIAGFGAVFLSRLSDGLSKLPAADGLNRRQLTLGPRQIAKLAEPLRSQITDLMARSIAVGFRACIPITVIALVLARFLPQVPLRANIDHSVELSLEQA